MVTTAQSLKVASRLHGGCLRWSDRDGTVGLSVPSSSFLHTGRWKSILIHADSVFCPPPLPPTELRAAPTRTGGSSPAQTQVPPSPEYSGLAPKLLPAPFLLIFFLTGVFCPADSIEKGYRSWKMFRLSQLWPPVFSFSLLGLTSFYLFDCLSVYGVL